MDRFRGGAPAYHTPVRKIEDTSRLCPKRAAVVEAYTQPEPSSTTLCLDELGPVCARSFVPAPGWSVDGHRIKAPLEYGRGLDKTWVYGALCVRDGQALTLSAPSRNTAGYLQLLQAIERAYPDGKLTLIGDNREQS